MNKRGYESAYAESVGDPEHFWLRAADAVDWDRKPTRAWDPDRGWFADGLLNTCYNAVDRHVEMGNGGRTALIYENPVTAQTAAYTYVQLRDEVARTAGMLARLGVGKGDRVIIYMPMIPETVFAMLACARIGAVHSVVFGGFAAPELAKRIDAAEAAILLTASCGIEGSRVIPYKPLIDRALELAWHKLRHVVVLQRPQEHADTMTGRYLDWHSSHASVGPVGCVSMASTDPLYILYTSGTTGTPKGVVRDNGGHATALAWSMQNIYGMRPGERFWAASDVGWVVGHSYIVYAPLIAGCTTVLFEGKPVGAPDAGVFWRTIRKHDVDVFFTAPSAVRAIRREDPKAEFLKENEISNLRAVFLAGERADPETIGWAEEKLAVPVIDHWWQTELGWPAIATCLGLGDLRRKGGSAGFPVPGYSYAILDQDGIPVPEGETGSIVIKTPLPPGCYAGLWNDTETFNKAFATFPGYYETGDSGFFDAQGFLHVMGRVDDIINVAGHRLSTGQMEQIVAMHPAIAECAVVGANDPVKGVVPVAFAVLSRDQEVYCKLKSEIILRIREGIGPVASLKRVYFVASLPKTRSGKIRRALLRAIVNRDSSVAFTTDDAEVIAKIVTTVDASKT